MKTRDFKKKLKQIDEGIETLKIVRDLLIKDFKQECNHPVRYMFKRQERVDDEYGRRVPTRDLFVYSCKRCGTAFSVGVKDQVTTVKGIRQRLNEANRD